MEPNQGLNYRPGNADLHLVQDPMHSSLNTIGPKCNTTVINLNPN